MITSKIHHQLKKVTFLNFIRLGNLAKIIIGHYRARFFGAVHLQFPYALSLELASVCNLKCPQCPVGMGLIKRNNPFMDKSIALKRIDEFAPKGLILSLYFQGESLLHPNIAEIISHAVKQRLFTILSTNAHFLNQSTAYSIVKAGLHRIIISIDGYSQESYAQYREGGDLDVVWQGLQYLVDARKTAKSIWPEIFVQTVVNKYNEKGLDKIKSKAKHLGADKVLFKTMQIYNNHEKWLPKNKKYSRYVGVKIIKKPTNKCFRAFSSMVITSDGMYVPCCFDKFAAHTFKESNSNISTMAFSNDRYQFLSKIYTSGEMHSICNNCPEATHVYKKANR